MKVILQAYWGVRKKAQVKAVPLVPSGLYFSSARLTTYQKYEKPLKIFLLNENFEILKKSKNKFFFFVLK